MVSHKLKCIFVEVPKTASTSIRKVLGFPVRPHLDILEIRSEMINDWPVRKGARIIGKFNMLNQIIPLSIRRDYVKKTFDKYFKFGFVRNPWDRVVSLYFRKEGVRMSEKMTFEEFAEWIQNSSDTSIHASVHKNQLDWFTDENGKVIVDFIGRFEKIEDDFNFVMNKLGIDKQLPYVNRSKVRKKHYTEYYSPRTRDIIAGKFKVDIEYFGYEFGN